MFLNDLFMRCSCDNDGFSTLNDGQKLVESTELPSGSVVNMVTLSDI